MVEAARRRRLRCARPLPLRDSAITPWTRVRIHCLQCQCTAHRIQAHATGARKSKRTETMKRIAMVVVMLAFVIATPREVKAANPPQALPFDRILKHAELTTLLRSWAD